MMIYKIVDMQTEGNEQVGQFYARKDMAQKRVNSILGRHVMKIATQINKLTGIKRGVNVDKFNNLVNSIANTRYIIESVEVNDNWR